jgi:hypothetical protein
MGGVSLHVESVFTDLDRKTDILWNNSKVPGKKGDFTASAHNVGQG